jgi:hypothetical protein
MESLVDLERVGPALPGAHPFTGVQFYYTDHPTEYWLSSSYLDGGNDAKFYAWSINMEFGEVYAGPKLYNYYVWPLRGGQ